jgi:hypothetical protein
MTAITFAFAGWIETCYVFPRKEWYAGIFSAAVRDDRGAGRYVF